MVSHNCMEDGREGQVPSSMTILLVLLRHIKYIVLLNCHVWFEFTEKLTLEEGLTPILKMSSKDPCLGVNWLLQLCDREESTSKEPKS